MLTKERLDKLSPGVFDFGVFENSPDKVYLDDNCRKVVRWVAVRWSVHDWVIYYEDLRTDSNFIELSLSNQEHWDYDVIARMWHKLSKSLVRKVLKCNDEAFNLYRN